MPAVADDPGYTPIGMRVLWGGVRLSLGAIVGVAIAPLVFLWSLARGRRAVHADGVLARATVIAADDPIAARLTGPAVVRLSGALMDEGEAGSDILGMSLRWLPEADADLTQGDQDLLLGTFASFWQLGRARARTRVDDYLANHYQSVSPWWLRGLGVVKLEAVPRPAGGDAQGADRAPDRRARLAADIEAGRARFELRVAGDEPRALAEVRLESLLSGDGRRFRTSMARTGRGLRPLGARNGIRVIVYPVSQIARRLRGG